MLTHIAKSLAVLALLTATAATAQISGGISGGGGVSGGVSGVSGVSGGLGIDFAAGQAGGINTKKDGGLASSLDAAFEGEANKASTDCGKLKCDQ